MVDQSAPFASSWMVKSYSLRATKSSAAQASMLSTGSTATLAPMKPILAVGLMARIMPRGLAVRLEAGRGGVDDDQLMRLHVLLDVLEGQIVRRRVDQARARHHRGGLGQPGGKPEALHLPLHLVARAGAAVIAVEGRSLEEKRFHRPWHKRTFRDWDIAPDGSTAKWRPRQCTVSPNSDVTKTAKLNRSRSGNSQNGPGIGAENTVDAALQEQPRRQRQRPAPPG